MAQMMRAGLYRPVHVKTLRSQKLRMLLTHRKLLQSKAIAIENGLRGTLRSFGLKVGIGAQRQSIFRYVSSSDRGSYRMYFLLGRRQVDKSISK
jgi:transposase